MTAVGDEGWAMVGAFVRGSQCDETDAVGSIRRGTSLQGQASKKSPSCKVSDKTGAGTDVSTSTSTSASTSTTASPPRDGHARDDRAGRGGRGYRGLQTGRSSSAQQNGRHQKRNGLTGGHRCTPDAGDAPGRAAAHPAGGLHRVHNGSVGQGGAVDASRVGHGSLALDVIFVIDCNGAQENALSAAMMDFFSRACRLLSVKDRVTIFFASSEGTVRPTTVCSVGRFDLARTQQEYGASRGGGFSRPARSTRQLWDGVETALYFIDHNRNYRGEAPLARLIILTGSGEDGSRLSMDEMLRDLQHHGRDLQSVVVAFDDDERQRVESALVTLELKDAEDEGKGAIVPLVIGGTAAASRGEKKVVCMKGTDVHSVIDFISCRVPDTKEEVTNGQGTASRGTAGASVSIGRTLPDLPRRDNGVGSVLVQEQDDQAAVDQEGEGSNAIGDEKDGDAAGREDGEAREKNGTVVVDKSHVEDVGEGAVEPTRLRRRNVPILACEVDAGTTSGRSSAVATPTTPLQAFSFSTTDAVDSLHSEASVPSPMSASERSRNWDRSSSLSSSEPVASPQSIRDFSPTVGVGRGLSARAR